MPRRRVVIVPAAGTKPTLATPVLAAIPPTIPAVTAHVPDAKHRFAQFFSTNATHIFQGFPAPPSNIPVVEPFAGRGDLIDWLRETGYTGTVDAYDIMPQHHWIRQQDTLQTPPDYTNRWVVTNPPYIARNKTTDHRALFDAYSVNDLYKIFLMSLIAVDGAPLAKGGYVIIPLNFLCSMRHMDNACRAKFFNAYSVRRINLFEETVFEDTACTVIAMWFTARPISAVPPINTRFKVYRFPAGDQREFILTAEHKWLPGGEIYSLPSNPDVTVTRAVDGVALADGHHMTNLVFNAIDSGNADGHGRISLTYAPDKAGAGIESARTYATLVVGGMILSPTQQQALATQFNERLNEMRDTYWSLFLTNYRESKDYARKRAPFQLCYLLVRHLLTG